MMDNHTIGMVVDKIGMVGDHASNFSYPLNTPGLTKANDHDLRRMYMDHYASLPPK